MKTSDLTDVELHATFHRYYCRLLGAIWSKDLKKTCKELHNEIIARNPDFYDEEDRKFLEPMTEKIKND